MVSLSNRGGCVRRSCRASAAERRSAAPSSPWGSSSPEAEDLRRELNGIVKKSRRVTVGEIGYELRVRVYDSFGEDAFRVRLQRV